MEPVKVMTSGGRPVIRVERHEDLPQALLEMDLESPRPVLVSVGGAGRMAPETVQAISDFLTRHLVPALDGWHVAVVDGGTDSGVMRAMGQARGAMSAGFPLVGVAAEGTVMVPNGKEPGDDLAPLEPNHTHTIVVPGDSWGDESPWLSELAAAMAGDAASVTLLANGGEISYDDADRSLSAGRPLVVLEGTGRTADAVAAAARGDCDDPRARAIAASPLTRVVPLEHPETVLAAVADALALPRK